MSNKTTTLSSLINSVKAAIQSGPCSVDVLESYFNQLNDIEEGKETINNNNNNNNNNDNDNDNNNHDGEDEVEEEEDDEDSDEDSDDEEEEEEEPPSSLLKLQRIAFFHACAAGQLAIVDYLLKQNKSLVETEDDDRTHPRLTALMISSQNNHLEIVKLLLSNGAQVDREARRGELFALFLACREGNVSIAQLLLENKADLSLFALVNRREKTCLEIATENNHLEIVKLLLFHGADINESSSPLLTACGYGHIDLVRFLLENGADINSENPLLICSQNNHLKIAQLLLDHAVEDINKRGYDGTPLYHACKNGNIEMVKLFLQNKADPNIPANRDFPLTVAAVENHFEIVKLLIAHGAKVDAHTLGLTCERGNIEIVQYLLDHGADVNESFSPLAYATRNNHLEVVKLLVDRGVDVNIGDGTAIYRACEKGYTEIARYLLEHNATVNPRYHDGRSLLVIAIQHGHLETAKLLLDFGAEINKQDNYGKTALLIACENGDIATVSLLLQYEANPNISTLMEVYPLFVCIENNYFEIARLLLACGAAVDQRVFNKDKVELREQTLYHASEKGSLRAVELFVQNGADVNARVSSDRDTVLMTAIKKGHINIAKFLIKKGARVNDRGRIYTALTAASQNNIEDMELFQLLIDNGVNVNDTDVAMYSSLMWAVLNDNIQIIEFLIKNGADVNMKNAKEETALMRAFGNVESLKLLIKGGANVNEKDKAGNTALHGLGFDAANVEAVRLLIANGADSTLVNNDGKTAFDVAENETIRATLVQAVEDHKIGKLDHLIIH